MSKTEKLKKICKKVWKRIIPLIIISAVIGAILIIPKYYNNGGGTVETEKLTAPPSHNWEILGAIIGGMFFTGILILVFILNARRKNLNSSKAGKTKISYSYGKFWRWIVVILFIGALAVIAPKYIKKGWKEVTVSKSAFYGWKKLAHQYGYNREQRSAGPLKTKITKYDDKHLSFIVYGPNGKGYFDGWKIGKNEFKGKWRCPEANSGGEWILKKKSDNPETYVGVETDPSLPNLEDGKPSELIILD